ncbi:SsrA-binding protein SmpB [Fulvivirga lutimaris]|uniref:SsrA-binding protein SmpB n=1 Tax=Fulvivirga lutimaris TaxID=1819566 RepID=UPI0012BB76BB|nr:SsrA-binding protein SmpB [Fulvivirga lutimaris]MTI39911.1 SsrA-binding protein SmpB [Fulvivirga lutimaris]
MNKKDKSRFSNDINIKNKRAKYEYEFIDTYLAGLVLKGTEIKSIREGKVNLQDGYCYFRKGELYSKGIHISPYAQGSFYNHEEGRERKLLLKRQELGKLESKMNEKGLTIIPTRLFINDRGLAKMEIALAKGKKIHDKRDSIKDKDLKREFDRVKI